MQCLSMVVEHVLVLHYRKVLPIVSYGVTSKNLKFMLIIFTILRSIIDSNNFISEFLSVIKSY